MLFDDGIEYTAPVMSVRKRVRSVFHHHGHVYTVYTLYNVMYMHVVICMNTGHVRNSACDLHDREWTSQQQPASSKEHLPPPPPPPACCSTTTTRSEPGRDTAAKKTPSPPKPHPPPSLPPFSGRNQKSFATELPVWPPIPRALILTTKPRTTIATNPRRPHTKNHHHRHHLCNHTPRCYRLRK